MSEEKKQAFWGESVRHLPLQNPLCLKQEDTVEACILAMQKSNLGCVFIVNDSEKLIGIFTDKDVIEHFLASSVPKHATMESLMTEEPIIISGDVNVLEAIEVFYEKRVRHLPVVDDGAIKGLLSVRVLMDFIAENLPKQVLNLPPDKSIVPTETSGA